VDAGVHRARYLRYGGESTATDDACYRQVVTNTVTSDVNVVTRGFLGAQNR
jgi:X-Pro dipeptidyl-peptidase